MKDCIEHRLTMLANETESHIIPRMVQQIQQQDYKALIPQAVVQKFCNEFQIKPVDLALQCLPIAACYALTPISHFNVGAIAIGISGNFYFGANQEFTAAAMQQTVHAEQSAISHAWIAGEKAIMHMVVNYTPCGHCRQFMNELNTASQLRIHLPHSQNHLLHSYLPDAFGPKDLNIEKVLFDPQIHSIQQHSDDPVVQAVIAGVSQSYAPYSQALSAVALQIGEQIIVGRYAENAAFNPSFLPLQSALNYQRLQGYFNIPVSRIVMAEVKSGLSHKTMTESLAKAYLEQPIEYISL
ncbi:cytidine deaminase [Mannheimia massilioguelmaensis]|uniref:cytidine deaminase n=1 Tax=Mannheimia massilioguelmaensis TaxID=1604354 RepID=UPI00069796A9|nr:cytidine deaminase [Mannheimia massilioguelmaensis]